MPRKLTFTPEKKEKFLELLRQGCSGSEAARNLGFAPETVYWHKSKYPEFNEAWAKAYEIGGDVLESEAISRAVEGWDEPVFGKVQPGIDGQIGVIRKKSDRLLEVALKGRRSIYKDNPRFEIQNNTVNVQIEDRTAKAHELIKVLREVGADVIEGEAVEVDDSGGPRAELPPAS